MRLLTGCSGTNAGSGTGAGGGLVGAFAEGGFLFRMRPIKQLFWGGQVPLKNQTQPPLSQPVKRAGSGSAE